MPAGRRSGPRIPLGVGGAIEHWLTSGTVEDGERRLAPEAALTAARRAVMARSIELSRIQTFVANWGLLGSVARGRAEQWRALEAAIRRGRLSVVERPRAPLGLGHEVSLSDAEQPPIEHEPEAIEDRETVGEVLLVRVIEAVSARPVAALAVELDAGDLRAASTNSAGELRFEDVRRGLSGLRLDGVDAVTWGPDAEQAEHDEAREGERSVHVAVDLGGRSLARLGVETGILNWVVIERPALRMLVPDFLRFDHDSALLVPAPWTDGRHPLAGLVHALVALIDGPERWLLVVGHASAPGSETTNQDLSEHRADAIRALVEGDADAWVEHARKRGSLRDVIAYLDYLGRRRGWPCSCEAPLESLGTAANAATRASVGAFQEEYAARFDPTLKADEVCGVKTLGAVFEVLRDELERWLAKLGASPEELPLERVVYTGYGATLAGREGPTPEAEGADRIVDLILVEGVALIQEPAVTDLDEVYDSGVPRRLPFEIPDEPDEWATGPFTIVSDLTPDEPVKPETYELRSADGSWASEHILPDDGVVESGELTLHFEALPTELRYSLVVTADDGTRSVIFEDLGYGELHRSSPGRS